MHWECERDCGFAGEKRYVDAVAARRYAAAFDREDRHDIGRRSLLSLLPLRLHAAAVASEDAPVPSGCRGARLRRRVWRLFADDATLDSPVAFKPFVGIEQVSRRPARGRRDVRGLPLHGRVRLGRLARARLPRARRRQVGRGPRPDPDRRLRPDHEPDRDGPPDVRPDRARRGDGARRSGTWPSSEYLRDVDDAPTRSAARPSSPSSTSELTFSASKTSYSGATRPTTTSAAPPRRPRRGPS